jgi:type I restriction enzyme S subunit
MKPERLLELYERISEAPDAIARLRRFVLDLAMRGKLVEQDPADEPASVLLKSITSKKSPGRSFTKADTVPSYDLPGNWLWISFGDVHHLVRGVTYSKSDVSESPRPGFVPILRANNIGPSLTHDDPVFVRSARVSPDQYLRRGDYMIALSSGSKNLVGKAALVPDNLEEAFGGFCGAIRVHDFRLVAFVGVFLRSDLYRESISAGSRGIGINNLKMEVLAGLLFPLPPLAEQHRIVAKVDELMALCDRLEEARKTREETRDRLTAASLARLTAPETTDQDFPTHARFALDTLPASRTAPTRSRRSARRS